MIHTVDELFAGDGWEGLHDVLCNLDGKARTPAEVRAAFDALPDSVKIKAMIWGLSDTEFGDAAYLHFKRHGVPVLKADGGTPCPTP